MQTGPSDDEVDREALGRAGVAEVAAALSKDRTGLVDELYRRLSADIEQLRGDENLLRLLNASIEGNIDSALHILQYGIDVGGVEVPPAAVEYARRLAQHGVPVRALVRAYRLGQDSFLQWSFAVLNAQFSDPHQLAAGAEQLTAITFAYIDRVTEQVLEAYEDERERWLQQRHADREARVHELLRGDRVDLRAAEKTLGYQLTGRRHLAVIVWTGQDELAGSSRLARFTRDLAEWLGCPAHPLFVLRDQVTGWAWLPLGRQTPAVEVVRDALGTRGERFLVAAGEPSADLDGFRRSHQQARQVQALMVAAQQEPPAMTSFGQVGPVAVLCGDLAGTKAWVRETLGPLALDDDAHARLRETLRVFLATGGSYIAAAQQLALHRNSVHYRVRKAEEELGCDIATHRLDVELALKTCRWLGRSVLTPAV